MTTGVLRRGDLVEVRSPGEILATLDATGALEGLPFMPEMAAMCGRRFTVDRRAERVCDTLHYSWTRRLSDAVFLEQERCDGKEHGGCQAECRILWKEAWLRPADAGAPAAGPFLRILTQMVEELRAEIRQLRTPRPAGPNDLKLWP